MGGRQRIVVPVREILRAAALDRRLLGCDHRVLAILQAHVSAEGWCIRSQRRLGDELGVNRVTVMRSIARLGGIGYLEVDHRAGMDGGNAAAAYRIRLPDEQLELMADPGHTGASAPVTPVQPAPESRDDSAPESPGVTTVTSSSELPPGRDTHIPREGPISDHQKQSELVRHQRPRRRAKPAVREGQRELLPAVAVSGNGAGPVAPTAAAGGEQRMSAAWGPSDIDRAWAAARGVAGAEIDEQGERCRDHWLAKPGGQQPGNASAAWRSWVRGYLDRGGTAKIERGGNDHGQTPDRRRAGAGGQTHAERLDAAFRTFGGDDRD